MSSSHFSAALAFGFPLYPAPTDEQIAQCAYLIWERENRPEGRDKIHWEQARAQLVACYEHDQWMAMWASLLQPSLRIHQAVLPEPSPV